MSTSWIKTREEGQKREILPRLRSSASVFFSPGMWWMLRKMLNRICWVETNLIISDKTSVLEKRWLMLASAPVLSDPDWILMMPGLVVHFWLTKRSMQSWAKASQEEIYLWRLFGISRKGCNSCLFQIWLNQKRLFSNLVQPPMPISSSVANASAAAEMVIWVDLFKGMDLRSGSKDRLDQSKVSFDVSDKRLLSQFGSLSRIQACRSMGMSRGSWEVEEIGVCLNSTTFEPIGRWRRLCTVMVAQSLRRFRKYSHSVGLTL